MHYVVDALWYPHRIHDFAKKSRRAWGFLRRLDHNGVAASQRRSDLPGHQQEREIPRAYHRNHALRLAHRVIDCPPAIGRWHRERFVRHRRNNIGEHPEICCAARSEEHTSELQSLMRISYAVFCLKKKKQTILTTYTLIKKQR